jgi:hypothetical protein
MQGLSTDLQKKLLLTVGSHRARRPLLPVEVGQAIQASLDAGSPMDEIAQWLHLDDTSVLSDFVRLLQLASELRHLVAWGRADLTIGFKAASEIARLSGAAEQIELCQAAVEHKLGSAEVRQVVQLRRRSKKTIKACVQEVLGMRPRVQRVHILLGAVTSPKVRNRLATLDQTVRDELLRSAIQSRFPALTKFSCRLGTDGFTVGGSQEVAVAWSEAGNEFEAAINDALAGTLAHEEQLSR